MELRPYQSAARDAILNQWADGINRTLLVLPTGCGKTIVFAKVIEERVRQGGNVLILAHREELLQQASDKLSSATGLATALEKAESTSVDSWFNVTVGSVQTLQSAKRLERFAPDHFDTIVVDEAHHAVSSSYRRVLDYFKDARVLGVTATADRGDKRNLGEVFETIAYEYTLVKAIREGYLSPIRALTLPLSIDLSGVKVQSGDFQAAALGSALDPYLDQIAVLMAEHCRNRKTVVFLPLVATSQKMRDLLIAHGMTAAEVNGESKDRAEVLADFHAGRYQVLCNSMLLTEGWDEPAVDCIVCLRPTKVRALYCLDEVTEVLTESGWKKDIAVGEKVAAFTKEGRIVFTEALATIRRKLNDDEFFCSIKGPSTDIRVTNRHRMVYDNKRRKGWKIKTAEELASMTSGCHIPVSGHGKFKGVPLTDDELRFIGWVMTDGTINKTNHAIMITQGSQQPWIEKIQACIDGCGFKNHRFTRPRDTQFHENGECIAWSISKGEPRGTDKDKRGWGDLEPYLSKDLSPLLFDMTEEQFDVMLEAIHYGDGAKQNNQNWTQQSYHITKGNKTFIERLQMMAIARGWRANMSEFGSGQWTLHAKKQEFVNIGSTYDGRPSWIMEPHTDESCWCVQNDIGTLVTRRNGKVAIVGNCQIVGRGTRLAPGKKELLLLDFLWQTEKHDLCRPAHLICQNDDISARVAEIMAESSQEDGGGDLLELEGMAEGTAVEEREESLRKELEAQRMRKRQLVDPLQFEMSISPGGKVAEYEPDPFNLKEQAPPSAAQLAKLEKAGIFPDEVKCAGHASRLIDTIEKRRAEGLATAKQIRCLERYGFRGVGTWEFISARDIITRIAANRWSIPHGIVPATYVPTVPPNRRFS